MALQVWLPLTKDLRNQGLSDITVTNNGATFSSAGKLGGCYEFASGKRIQTTLPASTSLKSKAISFACWMYVTSWNSSYDCFMSIADGTGWNQSRATLCRNNTASTLTWNIADGSNRAYVTTTSALSLNTWTHVAGTYDGTNLKIYINGVLNNTATSTLSINYAGIFNIGGWSGANYPFNGKLNDVRIYDHCLSPMEVKELSKGLILHYPLNRQGWGQENLLPGTNLGTTSWNWTMQAGNYTTAEETTLSGVRGCKFTRGTTAQSGWSVIFYNNINESLFKASTKYKLSVDIYPSVNTNFVVSIRESNGTNVFAIAASAKAVTANKWNHLEFDLTTVATLPSSTGETIYFQSMDSSTGVSYIFRNLKLEEGEIATPWCPNSSDILATTMGLNGTTEYDISGFCNNGIRYGTFNFNSETPKYAVSTQYNGTDNTLKIPFDASVWPDNFTMSIWFRKDELGSKSCETLFGGPSGFEMDTRSGAATTLSLYMASVRGGNVYTGFEFGKWYMVTLVNDGVNELYYINGDLVKTIEKKSMPVGTYYIGSWQTANKQNYMGLLSDARIYATALSASDIKSLYQNCATIDADGTIHGQIRS